MRLLSQILVVSLACALVLFFATFVAMETAPRAWDEAFLLYLPTKLTLTLESGRWLDLFSDYFGTRIFKPPLSMIGTSLSMGLFGSGSFGFSLDNLAVAILIGFLMQRFLARFIDASLASAFAVCALASPFALAFVRTELAELYVWACTLSLFIYLLTADPLRSNRKSVVLGVIGGLGVASKLSFPLIAGPLAVWVLVAELWRARRSGEVRGVCLRVLISVVTCVLIVGLLCHKNWKHMWRHLRSQYGWVGEQYGGKEDRLTLGFFEDYMTRWAEFFGWLWVALGVVVIAGLLARGFVRFRRGASETVDEDVEVGLASPPYLALLFAFVANLSSCYFFPVADPRFTIGAFTAGTLLVAAGAGSLLRGHERWAAWCATVLAVAFLALLTSNSFTPDDPSRPVFDFGVPGVGRIERVLPPPCQDPDLRDAAFAAVRGAPTWRFGLGGDHRSFNIDNLRRRALQRGLDYHFGQVGYVGADLTIEQRLKKFEEASAVDAWLVCVAPDGSNSVLWTTRLGQAVLDALIEDVRYEKTAWVGALPDGTKIHAFRRR